METREIKKKIRSILNCTPHCLATCLVCGEQGGSSYDVQNAKTWLHKHMRKTGHNKGSLEVGRVSHYELINPTL